jgi:hypothetical protein
MSAAPLPDLTRNCPVLWRRNICRRRRKPRAWLLYGLHMLHSEQTVAVASAMNAENCYRAIGLHQAGH